MTTPLQQAVKVWYAGAGRDYALMPSGDVLSVNAVGLQVIDVRWAVTRDGVFVGDLKDAELLEAAGYTNVVRYQRVTPPPTPTAKGPGLKWARLPGREID